MNKSSHLAHNNPFIYACQQAVSNGWTTRPSDLKDTQLLQATFSKDDWLLSVTCGINPVLGTSFSYNGKRFHSGEMVEIDGQMKRNPMGLNQDVLHIWEQGKLNTRLIKPTSVSLGLTGHKTSGIIDLSKQMSKHALLMRYAKMIPFKDHCLIACEFSTNNVITQFFIALTGDEPKKSTGDMSPKKSNIEKPSKKPTKTTVACADTELFKMQSAKQLSQQISRIAKTTADKPRSFATGLLDKHIKMAATKCFMCESDHFTAVWTCSVCHDSCCKSCNKYASAEKCETCGLIKCETCISDPCS